MSLQHLISTPTASSVKKNIIKRYISFRKNTGASPTKVCFTIEDENGLLGASTQEIGDRLVSSLVHFGARTTFPKFLGMETSWDSKETLVL